MRSKWEWIRDACSELGYNEAARIADEIETLLKEIYGDTKTIAWMRDYIDIIKEMRVSSPNIWSVACSSFYCIGCAEDTQVDNCYNCRFKKRAGSCFKNGSLYSRFMEVFSMDAG